MKNQTKLILKIFAFVILLMCLHFGCIQYSGKSQPRGYLIDCYIKHKLNIGMHEDELREIFDGMTISYEASLRANEIKCYMYFNDTISFKENIILPVTYFYLNDQSRLTRFSITYSVNPILKKERDIRDLFNYLANTELPCLRQEFVNRDSIVGDNIVQYYKFKSTDLLCIFNYEIYLF